MKKDINDILNKFNEVKDQGNNQYTALCPAHNDTNPSLSINIHNDKVLLKCHAGCNFEEIIKAAGLNKNDFVGKKSIRQNSANVCNLKEYSIYKSIPIEYLKSNIKAYNGEYVGRKSVLFPYFNTGHERVGTRIRMGLNGKDKFRWQKGSNPSFPF